MSVKLQEGLLHRVLGIMCVEQNGVSHAEGKAGLAFDECREVCLFRCGQRIALRHFLLVMTVQGRRVFGYFFWGGFQGWGCRRSLRMDCEIRKFVWSNLFKETRRSIIPACAACSKMPIVPRTCTRSDCAALRPRNSSMSTRSASASKERAMA